MTYRNQQKYYVYHVIFNNQLIYVGKGTIQKGNKQRYHHVLSGCSHNQQLNEVYYHCKFTSTPFPEIFIEYFDTEEQALDKEHRDIYNHQPSCNVQLKGKEPLDINEMRIPNDIDNYVYDFDLDNY